MSLTLPNLFEAFVTEFGPAGPTVEHFKKYPLQWIAFLQAQIEEGIATDVTGLAGTDFDVRAAAYGAVGDGASATADTDGFAAAAADLIAEGEGRLRIPRGTYLLNAWPEGLGSNMVIEGDGEGATVIKMADGADLPKFIQLGATDGGTTDCDSLVLRHLTIDGNKTNNSGETAALSIWNPLFVRLEGVGITNFGGAGMLTDTNEASTNTRSRFNLYDGLHVWNGDGSGVHLNGEKNSLLTNARVHNHGSHGIIWEAADLGDPASLWETTQCIMHAAKVSDCAGDAVVLDAVARLVMAGLNVNAIGSSALRLKNTHGPSGNDGAISFALGNFSFRNWGSDGGGVGGIDTDADAPVSGALVTNGLMFNSSTVSDDQAGIKAFGWQRAAISECVFRTVQGAGIRVAESTDAGGATRQSSIIDISHNQFISCGNANATSNHAISIENSTSDWTVANNYASSTHTTAAGGGYEVRWSGNVRRGRVADNTLIAAEAGRELNGGSTATGEVEIGANQLRGNMAYVPLSSVVDPNPPDPDPEPDPDPDPNPNPPDSVPLTLEAATPTGLGANVGHLPGVATLGLPIAQGAVQETGGRPAVDVTGCDSFQARTLATWPDGSVKWMKLDIEADYPSTGPVETIAVDLANGTGKTTGLSDMGSSISGGLQVATGEITVDVMAGTSFNLFRKVVVGSTTLVNNASYKGLAAETITSDTLQAASDVTATFEENGPTRCIVLASGTMETSANVPVFTFDCRFVFARNSRDVEVRFTVRNATETHYDTSTAGNAHLQLDHIELRVPLILGTSTPDIQTQLHNGTHSATLSGVETAHYYQAQTSAETFNDSAAEYKPHLPYSTAPNHVQQGYEVDVAGVEINGLGTVSEWAKHPFMNLSGTAGGCTVAIQHLPWWFPGALEADASGVIAAEVFTRKNPANYTFIWRQYESRTAIFSFNEGATSPAPTAVPRRIDFPLTGRAQDFGYYHETGAFWYDLATRAEQEEAYLLMQADDASFPSHTITPSNGPFKAMRYLRSSTTGGPNNHPEIEKFLVGQWLRHGLGAGFLRGIQHALYRCEWTCHRSDDFADASDPGAANEGSVSHTDSTGSDEEHRYREGMVWAYYLSGDERIPPAIADDLDQWDGLNHSYDQVRSLWMRVRSGAIMAEFLGEAGQASTIATTITNNSAAPYIDVATDSLTTGWHGPFDTEARRYFYSTASPVDPPGGATANDFPVRGFFQATLGPISLRHVARYLGANSQAAAATTASGRLRDLAYLARTELWNNASGDPADWELFYSYALKTQSGSDSNDQFHSILLGMAQAFEDTGDTTWLDTGVEQLKAVFTNGQYADEYDVRPDTMHFIKVYRAHKLGGSGR
ncbi:MAG: hypothetical protein ACPGVG_05815 [Mycobacterium sp.]